MNVAGRSRKRSRQKEDREERARSLAEWFSSGISLAILLAVLGLITYLYMENEADPASIEIQPQLGELRRQAGLYYLPVEVANRGGRTATNLWVEVTLSSGEGEQESSQFTIAILDSRESVRSILVFNHDPSQGTLTTAMSYQEP